MRRMIPANLPAAFERLPIPALRALWRYRVALAGLSALALALWGEQMMREIPGSPTVGTALVQIAVLLVGLVAWVGQARHLAPPASAAAPSPEPATTSLPVRRAGDVSTVRVAGVASAEPPPAAPGGLRAAWDRFRDVRARVGWAGTAVGLLIIAGLAAWCLLLLRADFGDPLAPWIWLAALVALALTFAGMRPAPPGLVPHDPTEPAIEPPMTRGEWLAVGLILLVAVVVRVWNLETIPIGPYSDEGDRAVDARHINRGEPVNEAPFAFFGTGWWGVPSLYFWLVAQSLKVFGDTLAGARMIHALAGIGTVWYTYRLGRAVWSPRAGLLAGALLAVSDFAIQFSRTAGESTITLFTWTVCFYYLYRALQTRRPLDFVLSGLAGGFTLYGYVAGKLLPVFLALLAIYLLLRWGRTGVRRYLPGLVLMALAAALTYVPNGLYILSHPLALTQRYNGVVIFNHAQEMFATYGTNNWAVILLRQFGLTFSAFDVGHEAGPFYPTGMPILPVAWAAVWILGVAYMVWRLGDVRFAVLAAWILSGLAGAALTTDTPTVQRVAGMVPVLALLPAVYLDRVVRGIPPVPWRVALPPRTRVLRWALAGVPVLLVVLLGAQTLSFYFGPYTAAAHYYWYTLAGRYAAQLNPQRDLVYQMDVPEFYWRMGPALFLADQVQGDDLSNPSDDLPLTRNGDKNAHFLVFPSNEAYLPILQSYYPDGTRRVVNAPDGRVFFTAYEVDSPQFDARRQVTARYGPPQGPLFEQPEPRLGTLGGDDDAAPIHPPAWMTYPLAVQWTGGLVAPAYGAYTFQLNAPLGATLEIDGRTLLTSPGGTGPPVAGRIVLAKGVHQVRLAGTLVDPRGAVELRWTTDNGVAVPIDRAFIWNDPPGALLGTGYATASGPDWFTGATPATTAPLIVRRDGFLGWRLANSSLGGGTNVAAIWHGTLRVAQPGSYRFDPRTAGRIAVWIDGQVVGTGNVPGVSDSLPATVPLTAGDHALEVRFQATRDNTLFEFYWQPPGGPRELLPSAALGPLAGGAWPAAERPDAPSPAAALIGAAQPALAVQKAGSISGNGAWLEARGVGVLPDGRVVVGDTGHAQILVYDKSGKQVAAWGRPGDGEGQFATLSDIAVSGDGVIAALDAGHRDVQLFDGNGTLLAHLRNDQIGISPASGLAWGPDGKLYIADTGGGRVLRVSRSGQPEFSMSAGDATHQALSQPVDVAVTAGGIVYAADLIGRVVRFNAAGVIDQEWKVPVGGARGGGHLAVWGTRLAVTDPAGNTVNFIDLRAAGDAVLRTPDSADLGLTVPVGVAAGPDGRLYVLDSDNARVVILTAP
jgi:4-amino-4-deoxy-L-arabinose transferase-like glycosyltransferase/sugar lactone lactonase YvrE